MNYFKNMISCTNKDQNFRSPLRKKLWEYKEEIIEYLKLGVPINEQQIKLSKKYNIKDLTYEKYRLFLSYSLPSEYTEFLNTNFLLSKAMNKFYICNAIEQFSDTKEQYAFLVQKGVFKTHYTDSKITIEEYDIFISKWGNDLKEWWNENGKKEYEIYMLKNKNTQEKKTATKQKKDVNIKGGENTTQTSKFSTNKAIEQKQARSTEKVVQLETKNEPEITTSSDGRFQPWKPENYKEITLATHDKLYREGITEEYLLQDIIRDDAFNRFLDEDRYFGFEEDDIHYVEQLLNDGYFQKGDLLLLEDRGEYRNYSIYRVWNELELIKIGEFASFENQWSSLMDNAFAATELLKNDAKLDDNTKHVYLMRGNAMIEKRKRLMEDAKRKKQQ